jgi:hypothetical protein
VTGHLVTTQLDAEDTLRMVGAAFGLRVKDVPKADLLITLEAFLISQTSKGKRCLLIVDEAQNLTPRAVEELRMLSNFQFGNQALLQSFLVGQPEFREILQRPEMEQLRQRVAPPATSARSTRTRPAAISSTASSAPVAPASRASARGCSRPSTRPSGGIPRRINSVCDRLLLLGFLSNRTHLTVDDVTEVAREFEQESAVPNRGTPTPPLGPAAASPPVRWPSSMSTSPSSSWTSERGRNHQQAAGLAHRRPARRPVAAAGAQPAASGAHQRADAGMLQKLVNAVKRSPDDKQASELEPMQGTAAMRPVMCVVGARPNFMKMAPILRALDAHSRRFRPCWCTPASTTTRP